MPQGLLSLGINRGTTRWHRTRSGPAWRHAPRSEAWDTKAAGPRFARCVAGSSPGSRAGSGWKNQEQTVRLLMSGRRSQKKPMYGEMKCDVPGMKPDPSLGVQPRDRAHTTRLLGAPRPAEPAVLEPDRLASLETEASNPDAKDQRSRGDCDIPETRPLRTSCSGCTGFRGDRVHRGEPLLLGVNKEYQISYRLFARGP